MRTYEKVLLAIDEKHSLGKLLATWYDVELMLL